MPGYTPNVFTTQGAQAKALRGDGGSARTYAPNTFGGNAPSWVTSMAPHLSTPEAARPFGEDIALVKSDPFYASQMPDLNKMWNYSPHNYQAKVAEMLRSGPLGGAVADLKERKMIGTEKPGEDDTGNPITLVYRGAGQWRNKNRLRGEGSDDGGDDGGDGGDGGGGEE